MTTGANGEMVAPEGTVFATVADVATLVDSVDGVQEPDRHYYEVLVAELDLTKASIARARVLKLYDTVTVPGSARSGAKQDRTIHDFTFDSPNPKARPKRGKQLDDELAALEVRRRVLQAELDEWRAGEQAWREATTGNAAEAVPAAAAG